MEKKTRFDHVLRLGSLAVWPLIVLWMVGIVPGWSLQLLGLAGLVGHCYRMYDEQDRTSP
jgi:hypothetical protein